jgi:hypothetical protein
VNAVIPSSGGNDLLARLQALDAAEGPKGVTKHPTPDGGPPGPGNYPTAVRPGPVLWRDQPRATRTWPRAVPASAVPAPRGFPITTLDLSKDPEPIEWAVHKIFQTNSVNLLVAAPGSMKTWTLFSMGLAMARGEPWLGQYATGKKRKVLIVDWESGPGRVCRRLRMLTQGQAAEGLLYLRAAGLLMTDPAFWRTLRETIQDNAIEVVLYDSLAAGSRGVDENTVAAAGPLTAAGDIEGVTHIFIHHSGKSEGTTVRGSSNITAQADTIYEFTKPEGSAATELRCVMRLAKAGDGEQEEKVALRLTDAGGLQLDAGEGAPVAHGTDLARPILDLLRSGGGPKTREEIRTTLKKSPNLVTAALKALETDGAVVSIDHKWRIDSSEGRYGRVLAALARDGGHIKRNDLAQRARIKAADVADFMAKGWLRAVGRGIAAPLELPIIIGHLGLNEADAALVCERFQGGAGTVQETLGQVGLS